MLDCVPLTFNRINKRLSFVCEIMNMMSIVQEIVFAEISKSWKSKRKDSCMPSREKWKSRKGGSGSWGRWSRNGISECWIRWKRNHSWCSCSSSHPHFLFWWINSLLLPQFHQVRAFSSASILSIHKISILGFMIFDLEILVGLDMVILQFLKQSWIQDQLHLWLLSHLKGQTLSILRSSRCKTPKYSL